MRFYAEHTDISYGRNRIVEDLSMEIPEGKITALIGGQWFGKIHDFKDAVPDYEAG